MRFRIATVMAGVLALASACRSDTVPVRTIDIRIAADEAFRARTGWRETVRSRLQAVSAAYEKNLAIRWRLVDIIEWTPAESARTSEALLRDLRRHVPSDGADIVAGVTLRSIVEEGLGQAVPFDRVLPPEGLRRALDGVGHGEPAGGAAPARRGPGRSG